ncbi:MAG: hypothetical protein H7098_01160 [Oligoflexus sp.]|nr:hypothetical protein [Pseudopedobacter sp.]
MNKYNPNIHHRRSIRLKGYDYAQAGLYFVTICCQDGACMFNVGVDLRVDPITHTDPITHPNTKTNPNPIIPPNPNHTPKIILNDAGQMVVKWYYELQNKFPDIKCHEMVVMPNHFHCIVENVGADLRVCSNDDLVGNSKLSGDNLLLGNKELSVDNPLLGGKPLLGEHIGSPLHTVVQWFKTMTTNEYIRGVKTLGWQSFNGKLWQRNYYEHIIRDEKSYENIANYIISNPSKWAEDKFYKNEVH